MPTPLYGLPLYGDDDTAELDALLNGQSTALETALSTQFVDRASMSVASVSALPASGNWYGRRLVALDTNTEYLWQGQWRLATIALSGRGTVGGVVLTANVEKEVAKVTLPAMAPAGKYLVEYSATTGAGAATAHLQRVYFAGTELTAYVTDYLNNVPGGGDISKSDALIATHSGGAADVTLEVRVNASGGACRYARLTVTYMGF